MSSRRPAILRLALVFTALSACSEDAMTAFPEEDASDQDTPSFDVPSTDSGLDAGTDRGSSTDTPARDRGAAEASICPSSCAASAECDPCRTDGTPPSVQYCCISGLCVSMTGTCPSITDGGMADAMPTDGDGDGGDGAGGDAAGLDDAADPTDGATDDGGTPPADVGPPSDLGGDATTRDAAAGDATADAAADAPATMDAAVGRD